MVFKLLLLGLLLHAANAQTYTHQEAANLVRAQDISISSSGGCSNRADRKCTSFDGIHVEAIDGKASGCAIVITGGTETGHAGSRNPSARTHSNGWKIDVRKRGNDCITQYIKRTFTKISPNRWQAASGNIYLDESDHWDIQYGNSPRGKRATTDECLSSICQVESNCRPLDCKWDVNSLSCGYFQIKLDYYKDCYMPGKRNGESNTTAWKRCAADYDCSVQCIQAYTRRYGHRCGVSNSCEKIARLHNGGPNGCNKHATISYWNRMKTLLAFIFFIVIQLCLGQSDDNCISCICQIESNCKPLECRMDQGSLSCGYFQIKKAYYIDCYTPGRTSGESVDDAWKRCAKDYNCSVECVKNYFNRYAGGCNVSDQCEKMARLHNGGPNGCSSSSTIDYWNRVKSCLK
ncbi:Lysozyme [Aphelenchoides bicaudatus]|nr:Lysozyme [Aphelenchoides bicaudatus]